MTTLYSIQATKSYVTKPAVLNDHGEIGGRKRAIYAEYVFTALLATADSLRMCKIPKGARVLDVSLKADDLGTTGVVDVGWEASDDAVEAADQDGFLAAIDVNAAALTSNMSAKVPFSAGYLKKFSSEVWLTIKATTATTATSGTVQVIVEYVID